MKREKTVNEPLFHIVKRSDLPFWKGILIRVIAVLAAIVFCFLFAYVVVDVKPGMMMESFMKGNFGTPQKFFVLFKNLSILLLIALALTPAFRMKFWNIGAEGQVLVGALAAVTCAYYLGGKLAEPLLVILMLTTAVAAGALWGLIPAVFKAIWNANETLFTLMMNYIAACLVGYMLAAQFASASNSLPELQFGWLNLFPFKGFNFGDELTVILIAAAVTVLMFVYLRYSKHGYEIAVVGESENTARYIGINVKNVVIRTMIISGALCGLVGFLIVSVFDHSITEHSVGGQGFTAIMVAWLGKLNPFIMVVIAFLIAFLNGGADQLVSRLSSTGISPDFPDVIVGIILFFIVGCEFFVNYRIKFRSFGKEEKTNE